MKISRIFKTIFLLDFLAGLKIALREVFKPKKTINYPFEKGKISPRFRGELALRRYPNGKKDALLVNCVKPSVQLKLSQLNLLREKMEAEKLQDMISI